MANSSFGKGYPSRNPNIVTLVRKDGLRLPIHKEIKDLVAILMDLTEGQKYNINPNQTWGYANRAISGTNAPSNHSWGTAVDINAPSNPYGSAAWHRRNARGTKPFGLQLVCNIPQRSFKCGRANTLDGVVDTSQSQTPCTLSSKGLSTMQEGLLVI